MNCRYFWKAETTTRKIKTHYVFFFALKITEWSCCFSSHMDTIIFICQIYNSQSMVPASPVLSRHSKANSNHNSTSTTFYKWDDVFMQRLVVSLNVSVDLTHLWLSSGSLVAYPHGRKQIGWSGAVGWQWFWIFSICTNSAWQLNGRVWSV